MDLSEKFLFFFCFFAGLLEKYSPFLIGFLKQKVCNPRLLVPLMNISHRDPYPEVEYGVLTTLFVSLKRIAPEVKLTSDCYIYEQIIFFLFSWFTSIGFLSLSNENFLNIIYVLVTNSITLLAPSLFNMKYIML